MTHDAGRYRSVGRMARMARALVALGLFAVCSQLNAAAPVIAIILDDFGYDQASGERALGLPAEVAFSVLPHSPFGRSFAEDASLDGHSIMLHCPMESTRGVRMGPGGMSSSMSDAQLRQTLLDNLASVPFVEGMNNHMGSRLTADARAMDVIMAELGQRELFYVDSRTSTKTRAQGSAEAHGVPNLRRHVFLDHHRDLDYVRGQFRQLIKTAKRQGYALAIGHPVAVTLTVLEQELPGLAEQGVRLIPVRELLAMRNGDKALWPVYSSRLPKVAKNSKP